VTFFIPCSNFRFCPLKFFFASFSCPSIPPPTVLPFSLVPWEQRSRYLSDSLWQRPIFASYDFPFLTLHAVPCFCSNFSTHQPFLLTPSPFPFYLPSSIFVFFDPLSLPCKFKPAPVTAIAVLPRSCCCDTPPKVNFHVAPHFRRPVWLDVFNAVDVWTRA